MNWLDRVFRNATMHGAEDDPAMEVADLQDLCRACWDIITEAQRDAVRAKIEAKWKIEQAEDGP